MKKEVTVPVKAIPAKPATTKKVEQVICDICLLDIKSTQRRKQCALCRRDMHGYDWSKKVQCCGTDDRESGDYPDYYCSICWALKFKKYDQEYWDIQNELEKLEAALDKKILDESLNVSQRVVHGIVTHPPGVACEVCKQAEDEFEAMKDSGELEELLRGNDV